ncbi:MAG: hypothetical protein LLG01_06505 [Planctomycetaceae bacterium]|nr:hypothetical protein [Planctomycetaceae bacterium]
MELAFKPNLDDALLHWQAFWNKDIIKRPCVSITCVKDGAKDLRGYPGQFLPNADFDAILDQAEDFLSKLHFAGEAMPCFGPSFGPDQVAAFVGARLDSSPDSGHTTWSVPFVEDWNDVLPLKLGHGNNSWDRMLELCRKAAARGAGKFLVGMLDMHSNFDWLAAIRGPDRLCMDLIDTPELVKAAMDNVRRLYREMYDALYEAGGMAGRGTIGWLPYYCAGRYAAVQCDFCLLLSPPQFNEFVLPALTEECDFLDHTVYHYDGRGALAHFDAITGIKSLDSIQWTISAGDEKPSMLQWVDLLQRFQAKGKSLYVGCSFEDLKVLHPQLKPNLVYYCTGAKDERQADEILKWLENNT